MRRLIGGEEADEIADIFRLAGTIGQGLLPFRELDRNHNGAQIVAGFGALVNVRGYRTRRDDIHADFEFGKLQRRHLRQRHLTGFGCAVSRPAKACKSPVAVNGAGDNDAALSLLFQMRDRIFQGEKRPVQVDIQGALPVLNIQFLNRTDRAVNACIG
ncbi:hypothetical protein D3C71_1733370 [compost metagenome]